jgi:hypothetical protein
MTYQWIINMSKTTGATSGTGRVISSGTSEFITLLSLFKRVASPWVAILNSILLF